MDYGLWTMDYGLWTMENGLWIMDYGPWTMDHGPVIHLLYWCLVYWPLMAIMASALLYDDAGIRVRDWIYTSLVIAEIVTIIIFACVNYIYPQFIISKWFRETYGASRFWNIRLVDDWTMRRISVRGGSIPLKR